MLVACLHSVAVSRRSRPVESEMSLAAAALLRRDAAATGCACVRETESEKGNPRGSRELYLPPPLRALVMCVCAMPPTFPFPSTFPDDARTPRRQRAVGCRVSRLQDVCAQCQGQQQVAATNTLLFSTKTRSFQTYQHYIKTLNTVKNHPSTTVVVF